MQWRVYLLLTALAVTAGCGGRKADPLESSPAWRSIAISDSRLVAQEPRPSPVVAALAREASLTAVAELGEGVVSPTEVWTTIIDCRDPRDPRLGSYQGSESVYPASVIKLCYLVAAYDQNRTRALPLDENLRADLRDMIVDSNNKATNRILDRLTNTSFGPELDHRARVAFEMKRQTVANYMNQLGLDGLWPTNKTFDTDIPLYGRDVQWLGDPAGDNFEHSNMMTTDDTARLLYMIWRHGVVDHQACEEMLALLRRDAENPSYFTKVLPEGWTIYSKGGSTDLCRHDATICVDPKGRAIIIVSFTKNRNYDGPVPGVIERVAEIILDRMGTENGEWDQVTAEHPADQMRGQGTQK